MRLERGCFCGHRLKAEIKLERDGWRWWMTTSEGKLCGRRVFREARYAAADWRRKMNTWATRGYTFISDVEGVTEVFEEKHDVEVTDGS